MLQVFCTILVEDEDIIQIYHHKINGERSKYIVNKYHEICWIICQTKWNDYLFENTFFGLENNLPYISLFYWDMVVARIWVNLTENLVPLS